MHTIVFSQESNAELIVTGCHTIKRFDATPDNVATITFVCEIYSIFVKSTLESAELADAQMRDAMNGIAAHVKKGDGSSTCLALNVRDAVISTERN